MQSSHGFYEQALSGEPMLKGEPLIRAANFHSTPKYRMEEFDRQLRQWSESFSSVGEHDLDQYLATGVWHKSRPGLIVAMYNGYRDGYDVMMPLLERYDFVGWFFVPTAFVDTPASEQSAFAAERHLKVNPAEYSDGRFALSWVELQALDRNHVVASHTRSHSRLIQEDAEGLAGEILGPQDDFETHLGHRVRAFASMSGTPYGGHALTDRFIEEARYDFVFSNYKIQRIRPRTGFREEAMARDRHHATESVE